MKLREKLILLALLILAALAWYAADASPVPAASKLEQNVEVADQESQEQFGLLFTPSTESVEIGKAHRLVATPIQPEPAEACTTKNWASCNAHCGGLAFSCSRDVSYFFMGCLPRCQWVTRVTLTCGCP